MNPKLTRVAGSVPAEMLNAIQGCFTPAPFRYRLTTSEALANYEKAERLCSEAVKLHPAAPDLWIVRNRRIIALLGMWNLAGEPKYLKQAAREAGVSLSSTLPPGADIVPRFRQRGNSARELAAGFRPRGFDRENGWGKSAHFSPCRDRNPGVKRQRAGLVQSLPR
ncbi:hypothetical protein N9B65_08475 [Akkermansiaceae bacterium]|nr:hypothetical protein [Akkermansiaceae bacterium]